LEEDEFLDAGGKLLQPGASARFKVSSGDHTLTAAAIDDEGEPLGDDSADTVDVEVEKGRTRTINIDVEGTAIDIS
jgi:hypothetical protein